MPDQPRGATRVPRNRDERDPFVWCRDDSTGYGVDVKRSALRQGLSPVENVPLNWGRRPRQTQYETGAVEEGAPVGLPKPAVARGEISAGERRVDGGSPSAAGKRRDRP